MKNKLVQVYAREIGEQFQLIGIVFNGNARDFIDKIHDKIKYYQYQIKY